MKGVINGNRHHLAGRYRQGIGGLFVLLLAACGSGTPVDGALGGGPSPMIEPIASLTDGLWLKGDLHVHSDHSSDASNNPVSSIIRFAERAGFDFLAITDHDNHVDGDVAGNTWADPDFRSDSVILLYGAEWTTRRGHGNTFSARPYDHAAVWAVRDAPEPEIGDTMRRLGVHLSANHPYAPNNFDFNTYEIFRSVEIWGSPIWPLNIPAQAVWDDMLGQGLRITGLGGSDSHHGYPGNPSSISQNSFQRLGNYVGTPTTWVFARERSGDAVMAALGNGRVSVSVNPNAPRITLLADVTGDGEPDLMMGDNVRATGEAVTFIVRLDNLPRLTGPYTANLIRNGSNFGQFTFAPGQQELRFSDVPPVSGRSYYRILLTGLPSLFPEAPASSLLALNTVAHSNPIYFNFPLRPE